jgi:hypothetical protein
MSYLEESESIEELCGGANRIGGGIVNYDRGAIAVLIVVALLVAAVWTHALLAY